MKFLVYPWGCIHGIKRLIGETTRQTEKLGGDMKRIGIQPAAGYGNQVCEPLAAIRSKQTPTGGPTLHWNCIPG